MKIELCEDNGFMNDGQPTLVVLVVTRDDGKQVRIPYEAGKTIQQLYIDVQKVNVTKEDIKTVYPENFPLQEPESNFKKLVVRPPPYEDRSNQIEREDVIKCIKLHPREDDSNDLAVGKEYRIIDIAKKNGVLSYYEVLDDASDTKIRITMLPDEVELVKKFVRPPPRKQVYEDFGPCPACGAKNSLELKNDMYVGTCTLCGTAIEQKRKAGV